jgi:hypothetical protein
MRHYGWGASETGLIKHVGEFILMVEARENGEFWWRVDLPGDDGDEDIAVSLQAALVAAEEAMELIVDELFDAIVFCETD